MKKKKTYSDEQVARMIAEAFMAGKQAKAQEILEALVREKYVKGPKESKEG